MPPGRLRERARAEDAPNPGLTARRVVAVDEYTEREEGDVLGEREADRAHVTASAKLVVRETERRTVGRVHGEPDERPGARSRDELAEQRDVGVVVVQEAPVDGLRGRPDKGSAGAGSGGAGAGASQHDERQSC